MKRIAVVLCGLVAMLATAGAASAAQLIDRNATGVQLQVNTKGEALLTYHAGGKLKHVLVWGAANAIPPTKFAKQQKFQLDYSGGYGKYHQDYWKTFVNQCQKYDGPSLPDIVTECKVPDGSYWAVQQWNQPAPDLGYAPWTPALSATWMEISHWDTPLPVLEAYQDWVYSGRFQEIFGTYTYLDHPVYGFGTTNVGAPTDSFGRLIYLDTHNSVYGSGWRRENSFVSHNPTGAFCYGFYTFDPTKGGYQHPPGQTAIRGPGIGDAYRLIAAGPGVMPNIELDLPAFHAYDANNPSDVALQAQQTAILKAIGDKSCMAGHS